MYTDGPVIQTSREWAGRGLSRRIRRLRHLWDCPQRVHTNLKIGFPILKRVVIGGGISGLSAAYIWSAAAFLHRTEKRRAGRRDETPRRGQNARSIAARQFSPAKPEALAMITELGLENE